MLKIFLSIALFLGIAEQSAFYAHCLLNQHNRILPFIITAVLTWCVYQFAFKNSFSIKNEECSSKHKFWIAFLVLIGLSIPLWIEANFYPLGGWDAWSCWNLKAKFIFLGQEHWKNMFDPMLWRSNTHYPLLLPCLTVWFWDLIGSANQNIPMLESILFTLLSAGVLMFALARLTGTIIPGALMTAGAFSIPFIVTLSISQYSDIVIGLYLLCALVCLISDEMILCGLFTGLMSFAKTEGLVAATLLTILILIKRNKKFPFFLIALFLAALPTILFQLFLSPKNEAFTNGILSSIQPSTFERFEYIAAFTGMEFLSLKWNGLWLLLIAGLIAFRTKSINQDLRLFGIFIGSYLAILWGYYYINTFFAIDWWMKNTLNRILFSLIPTAILWLGMSFKKDA